ncbi:hypothetical protein E2C01_038486 [Portunus trituberculatus]|uniref:Uncharacterized protein n=1 Tax=Portunus trituberculatus TaxID=210409 RepID=A0A5B7FHC8_PORTR|nr:hypothetical protein [Portunus trituberculatus]
MANTTTTSQADALARCCLTMTVKKRESLTFTQLEILHSIYQLIKLAQHFTDSIFDVGDAY